MGLSQSGIRVCQAIAVLDVSRTPFLLQRIRKRRYTFARNIYFYGPMDTEGLVQGVPVWEFQILLVPLRGMTSSLGHVRKAKRV